MDFIVERAKSLISKKLGAAVGAEGMIAGANPELQGYPLLIYIIVQAIVDAVRAHGEARG